MAFQLAESERRINSAQVKTLCGGVSDMAIWRWARDRGFPEPIYIGKRKYWREAEAIGWLNNQPKQRPQEESVTPPWLKK